MTIETDHRPAPGLNELLGDTLRHGADLVHAELALLRAEMSSNIRRVAMGLVFFAVAAVFSVIALGLVVDAAVAWLAPVVGSVGTAAIICAAVTAVAAIVFLVIGMNRVRIETLYPERAASSLRRDAQMIQERVS